jgi:hypothetical protein
MKVFGRKKDKVSEEFMMLQNQELCGKEKC